ncbi:MAG: hypothetical protein COA52_16940 [Hyphomicrobiales bacterium]|nr:VCBS repeat-containing protein [Hyphomicrobiales bacterium]PCJ84804.1 MAG: hypothetical protein COA52_16940 [Hyphomicrobiales bacterium]
MKFTIGLAICGIVVSAMMPANADAQWSAKVTSSGAHKSALNRARGGRAAAKGGIPNGYTGRATIGGKKVWGWYTKPTRRYAHGALGDTVEGGGLAVRVGSKRYDLTLPKTQVFEDLAPRIADLNRDGIADIITIRTNLSGGAAIAVYTISGGKLKQLAATKPIGRANRWLNIAGIADFTGDGRPDIVSVVKPHIQGTLELHQLKGSKLRRTARAKGLSNHIYKSTELRLSAIADVNGDGVLDIIVPSFGQQRLVAYSLRGKIKKLFDVALSSPLNSPIGVARSKGKPVFVFRDRAGKLIAVSN